MLRQRAVRGLMVATLCLLAHPAWADIVVGVVLSLSGPAAAVGRAQQPVVAQLPQRIAGEPVRYRVRDDASDPQRARAMALELVEGESADLVIGSTTVAASRAIIEAMAGKAVPVVTPAAVDLGRIHAQSSAYWAFRTAPDTWLMANAVVAHLAGRARHRVAFVALEGAYGDQWWSAFGLLAQARKLEVISFRRFGTDAASWQWPSAVAHERPDAVMVAAAGSLALASVHGLRSAGFAGPIYQTNAVAVDAFRHACAGRCADVFVPASPARVATVDGAGGRFRGQLGAGATAFGAYVWDAGLLLQDAAPRALVQAQPGTAAFRRALRDALETVRDVDGVNGLYTMAAGDHTGLDQRAVMLVSPAESGWQVAN